MSSKDSIYPPAPSGVDEKRLESRFPVQSELEISWVNRRDKVSTGRATVKDHSEHGLGLKTAERIPKGTMVWMRDPDGELIKAVVRYSQGDDQQGWDTGVRLVPRELRSGARDPVRGAAELRWPAPSGRTSTMVVVVVDLSDNGAGVIAPHELPAGHSVQLIGEQFECFCAVRNCQESSEGGYRIGLMFARTPHDRQRGLTADWID